MKKVFVIAAAIVLLAGCKKDSEQSMQAGETVTLTATVNLPAAKMIPNDLSQSNVSFRWQEGDSVTISNSTGSSVFHVVAGSIHGSAASFTGIALSDMSNYSVSYGDGSAVAYQAGTFTPIVSGTGAGSNFMLNSFRPVLKLQLKCTDAEYGVLGGLPIGKIELCQGSPEQVVTTLGCDAGLQLTNTATAVYFPVNTTLAGGFTLKFYDTDYDLIMSKTKANSNDCSNQIVPTAELVVSAPAPAADMFCFTAHQATTVGMTRTGNPPAVYLEYKKATKAPGNIYIYSAWKTFANGDSTFSNVSLQQGGKVYIRAASQGNARISDEWPNYYSFTSTDSVSVSGNIMYLLDGTGNTQNLSNNWIFAHLFDGMSTLLSAGNLTLPATTLTENCYNGMFYGCTSLTTAPSLPATTLAPLCYYYMFSGCRSMTTAPSLPASTMQNNCYAWMFDNCSSLTQAPALPATTLAEECYQFMFRNCTALTSAPSLPATTLANSCYRNLFADCTSLVSAPELSAATLVYQCYYGMFIRCASLVSVRMLATGGLGSARCLSLFLNGSGSQVSSSDRKLYVHGSVRNHYAVNNTENRGSYTVTAID